MSAESLSLVLDPLLNIAESDARDISVVTSDITFEGVLSVSSDRPLVIAGKVVGSIKSEGAVILTDTAHVKGFIEAASLQVGGTIEPMEKSQVVDVKGLLILMPTARVSGDALYENIKIEYGAKPSGKFQSHEDARASSGSQQKSAPTFAQVKSADPVRPLFGSVGNSHSETVSELDDSGTGLTGT